MKDLCLFHDIERNVSLFLSSALSIEGQGAISTYTPRILLRSYKIVFCLNLVS